VLTASLRGGPRYFCALIGKKSSVAAIR